MDIKKAREDFRKGKSIYDLSLKVVYYARVSTDKDDQLNSLENQQKYFEEMINDNENWIFSGGYIDEGISGTGVKNRESFLKMIEDATDGKIDLILTKEISRFSRNTVDSIKYTEYLLKNGVIVYFISDNLNTIQEDAEFRLTIMSSLAQDEVRKLSERVKFGINRMIKDRKLIGGNLTGYYKKNGRYEINEKEAFMIRYLFESYASGSVGLKKIGKDLFKMGYSNSKGSEYSETSLRKMLQNPRYKGFYTARLTEIEDYKTHKKRVVPKEQQIIEKDDKIPAIVSEELWDNVNNLYLKRKKTYAHHVCESEKNLKNSKYSCKIYCKHCGQLFIRNSGGNRLKNPNWTCKTYRKDGVNNCASPIIKESYLDNMFIEIFMVFIKNEYIIQIIKDYKNVQKKLNETFNDNEIKCKLKVIENQKDKLLDLNLKGFIDAFEFKKRNDKLNSEYMAIKNKKNYLCEMDNKQIENTLLEKINIKNQLPNLMRTLVDKVEVEKIKNNRNNIRLDIYFNFDNKTIYRELKLDKKIKNI